MRGHRVRERKRKRKRWTDLNTTAWYRMERECPVGGDRGVDLDSDGPEPLATVGQLSSPRFASFFEPPLYTHKEEILLRRVLSTTCTIYGFLRRPPPLAVCVYLESDFPATALRRMHCEWIFVIQDLRGE